MAAVAGDGLTRETNTMPQWAGSCWYELRYLDPDNHDRFVDAEVERYWMGPRGGDDPGGVDLYVGGVEHAVLHLLYARFWHKVLYDLGQVSLGGALPAAVQPGLHPGVRLHRRPRHLRARRGGRRDRPDGGFTWNNAPVRREYGKMGKSLKNVVTPDEMCERYGADTFRLYEMSTGPMDVSRPWSTRDVVGSQRFLQRVWRNLVDETTGELRVSDAEPDEATLRALHKAIAGVHDDFVALHYNTAAAKLIELNNHLTKAYPGGGLPRSVAEPLVLMMAPLTPHIAEELWARLGHTTSLAYGPFPVADERYLVEETVEYPIQVNGKVRSRVTVAGRRGRRRGRGGRAGRREGRRAAGRARTAQGDRGARPPGQRGRRSSGHGRLPRTGPAARGGRAERLASDRDELGVREPVVHGVDHGGGVGDRAGASSGGTRPSASASTARLCSARTSRPASGSRPRSRTTCFRNIPMSAAGSVGGTRSSASSAASAAASIPRWASATDWAANWVVASRCAANSSSRARAIPVMPTAPPRRPRGAAAGCPGRPTPRR